MLECVVERVVVVLLMLMHVGALLHNMMLQ
jgi:hypothetical protein